jgi:hypothetical protein
MELRTENLSKSSASFTFHISFTNTINVTEHHLSF